MTNDNLERILKALANKRRLAILKYLQQRKEATVAEIAKAIRLSFKSTSRHLSILAAADILEKEQRSLQVFCRIGRVQKEAAQRILSIL